MNPTFENYAHWRAMMTDTAGITLDSAYCKERIAALSNEQDPSTRSFVRTYGAAHRDQVLRWFEQALEES